MSVLNKANIVAVMGGSGSGKSTFVKRELKRLKPKRLIIFDILHEYSEFGTPTNSLAIAVSMAHQKQFKIIYQPSSHDLKKKFDLICKLAFTVGEVVYVVEELNRVTDPKKAPADWQDCTSRGRHKAMSIYGVSQRPAGVDKDFFSNATKIRTGRLNFAADIKTLANVLMVEKDEIAMMKPLEYIEKDMNTHQITRGIIKI